MTTEGVSALLRREEPPQAGPYGGSGLLRQRLELLSSNRVCIFFQPIDLELIRKQYMESEKKSSLNHRVYETLRDAILRRKMVPGMKISILSLSKKLGVSRTPILLAMQRLSTEGLIVMTDNQAPKVVSISAELAREVFFMRILLEPKASSLAARFATSRQTKKLRNAIEHEKKMFRKRNFVDYLKANTQTHMLIAEMARNEMLKKTIKEFLDKSTIIISLLDPFYNYSETRVKNDYEEDLAILNAIQARDETLAAKMMKAHLNSALKALPLDSIEEASHTVKLI